MAPGHYYTIKTKRKKLKTGRLLFLLILCAFLAAVTLSVRFLGSLNSIQDQSAWALSLPQHEEGRENVIIYSVSNKEKEGLVTALVVAAYHPGKKDIRVIHLPTETLLEAENNGFTSVSQIYAIGGRELLATSVSDFLGLPIHSYLEIDEDFLPSAVDTAGITEISSGLEVKNGGDVLSIIHADGIDEVERIERRRQVLTAISENILNAGFPAKIHSFLAVSPLIYTDMSWRKLLSTIDDFKNIAYQDTVQLLTLPGEKEIQAEGTYWLTEAEDVTELVNWLNNDVSDIPRSQITVEVLNGSGIPGIANTLAGKLREEGFNIVYIGNADHYDYDVSQVICRQGPMDATRDVAVLVPNAQLLNESQPDNGVYVTVIVGKNYSQE
ncbi:MAG: LCP family protein [Bacillota bacterium]|nr:LCP family protein [Bacillota bacterium]MDW7683297.1 LCP family protein [Bacillota bacterium]